MTMLVMVGVRTETHTFRSQVGIASESDCLLGQLKRILDISDSDAGLKEEKLEGSVIPLEGRVRNLEERLSEALSR